MYEDQILHDLKARIAALEAELERERTNHRQTIHTAECFRKALARAEADVESLTIEAARNAEHSGRVVAEREQLREDLRAMVKIVLCHRTHHRWGTDTVVMGSRCGCQACLTMERHGVQAVLK